MTEAQQRLMRQGWYATLLQRALRVAPDVATAVRAADMAFADMPEPPEEKPPEPPEKKPLKAAAPAAALAPSSGGGAGGPGGGKQPGDYAPEPRAPSARGGRRRAGRGRARSRRLAKGLRLPKKGRMYRPDMAFAAEDWRQFRGPQGGVGWQNARTGEVRYQTERPDGGGGGQRQPKQHQRVPTAYPPVGTHEQEFAQTSAFLDQHLDRSGLHPTIQAEYGSAARAVMSKMTPTALQRMRLNCKEGVNFFADVQSLNQWFVQHVPDHPAAKKIRQGKGRVAGLYGHDTQSGYLSLDGGKEAGLEHATPGVYAHEFTHAVDGPHGDISESPEWQAAWQREVQDKGVSRYAWTSPAEGLAEFGRLLFTSAKPDILWRYYPACMQALLQHRLHNYAQPAGG